MNLLQSVSAWNTQMSQESSSEKKYELRRQLVKMLCLISHLIKNCNFLTFPILLM